MTINNLGLHYLEWGNESLGKVLLLHGFGNCAATWVPLASKIAVHLHVLALDQRGHGDSQWSIPDNYSIEYYASDVSSFIEALDIAQITIIGHSMGGNVALNYTASHPEKVSRLIIVDIGPEFSQKADTRLQKMISAKKEIYKSLEDVTDYLEIVDPFAKRELLRREAEYLTRKIRDEEFIWKQDRRLSTRSVDRSRDKYRAKWQILNHIICPTLILRGEFSDILETSVALEMVKSMPKAELVEVKGAGHYIHRDNPQRFEAVVFRFLGLNK